MQDEKKDRKLSIRSILFFDKKVEQKKIRRQTMQQQVSQNPNEISFIELGEQSIPQIIADLAQFFPISKTKFPHVLAKVPKKGVGVYQTSCHFENQQFDVSILTTSMSLLIGQELTKFLELKLHQKICLICYENNMDIIEINKKIQIWKSTNQSQQVKNSVIVVGLTHNALEAPSQPIISLCEKQSVLYVLFDPSTNFLPVLKIAKLLLNSYDGNTPNFGDMIEKLKEQSSEIESNLHFYQNQKVQKINQIWMKLADSAMKLIQEITNENETILSQLESSREHLNFVKSIRLCEQKIKNLGLAQNHYEEEQKFEGTNSEEFQQSIERVKIIHALITKETYQLSQMKRNHVNLGMSYQLMEKHQTTIEGQILLLNNKIVQMAEFEDKCNHGSQSLQTHVTNNDQTSVQHKVQEQNMLHLMNSKIKLQTKTIGNQINKMKANLEEILSVLRSVMKQQKQIESKKESQNNLFKVLVSYYVQMRLNQNPKSDSNQFTQIDHEISSIKVTSSAFIKEMKEFIEKYDETIGQQLWSSQKLKLELRNRKHLIQILDKNWRASSMKKAKFIKKTAESSVN